MRWDENETKEFVRIYLSHNLLWNPEHEDYKLRFRRRDSYLKICSQFKDATDISLNEQEVKIKIKNLRATYLQELVKIKQRSTPTRPYKSTIKWFNTWHMSFQNLSIKNLKEESMCEEQQDLTDDSQKVWVNTADPDIINGDHTDTDDLRDPFTTPNEDNYLLLLKNEPEELTTQEQKRSNIKTRKRKFKRHSPTTDSSDHTYRGSMDSNLESVAREDEFDIYGKYIASQLRGMGLERALRVQVHIQNLVSKARIDHLSEDMS